MSRAVGIDLGTTNSVVSVLEGGEPTVIANAEGFRTTPSIVAFTKDGEVLVGETAKRQAVTNVDRTIASVKRHMGTDWTTDIDGKKYTPQEISARTLMKLKRDVYKRQTRLRATPKIMTSFAENPNDTAARIPPNANTPASPSRYTALEIKNQKVVRCWRNSLPRSRTSTT